jgi:hypothetical protein
MGWIWLRIGTSALVNTAINLWVPKNAGKFLSSFSSRAQLHE